MIYIPLRYFHDWQPGKYRVSRAKENQTKFTIFHEFSRSDDIYSELKDVYLGLKKERNGHSLLTNLDEYALKQKKKTCAFPILKLVRVVKFVKAKNTIPPIEIEQCEE